MSGRLENNSNFVPLLNLGVKEKKNNWLNSRLKGKAKYRRGGVGKEVARNQRKIGEVGMFCFLKRGGGVARPG